MILVDTNIIIDFWGNPSKALKKVFIEETVATCGIIIKAELMHGTKTEKDFHAISEALSDFVYIPLDESIWDDVGKLSCRLRRSGITVPFQDAVLCALALSYNLLLWTNDSHFASIKTLIEDLRLFSPQN